MGRRAVIIGCGLLLGLLQDLTLPSAQTADLYQGCLETTIDRNGDGIFDELPFGPQEVAVVVGPPLLGADEAFNLNVVPFVLEGQERPAMEGDIFVYSALPGLTIPPHAPSCVPTSVPLVYWRLRRLEGDLTPCEEILGTPLPLDFHAIPSGFDETPTLQSDVCGVLAEGHFNTNCQANAVSSTLAAVLFRLPIERGALLYGRVQQPVDTPDPLVDLIVIGTTLDGSGQSSMFRSEIHARRALVGQPPPQC